MNALLLAIVFILVGIFITLGISNVIGLKVIIWSLLFCVIILAVYIEIKEKK